MQQAKRPRVNASAHSASAMSGGTPARSKVAIRAAFVHSLELGQLQILEDGVCLLAADGTIEALVPTSEAAPLIEGAEVIDYSGKIIVPGFVDAHCHAPQYMFSGTGMDLPLLKWLERYTFPSESRFFDLDFAKHVYQKAVRRHLKNGTTMSSYFATIHLDATKVLVDVLRDVGQRAFVGKVNMDRNSPDFYIEETTRGVEEAEQFIRYVLSQTRVGREGLETIDAQSGQVYTKPSFARTFENALRRRAASMGSTSSLSSLTTAEDALETIPEDEELAMNVPAASDEFVSNSDPSASDESDGDAPVNKAASTTKRFISDSGVDLLNKPDTPLVMPVITPRFVPTCSEDMMHSLGELSHKYGLSVQSHLSESPGEIAWVKELHPDCHMYAQVYEQHGLLHDRCYMAHCCHANAKERDLLRASGAGIVHCPSSNFMLGSGVLNVRRMLDEGLKIALGTDVAGGYSPSMLDAMRQAIIASRVTTFGIIDHHETDECPSEALRKHVHTFPALDYKEVFHLATQGGASVLGMGEVVGNFQPGKKFDALVVDVDVENSPIDTFDIDGVSERFQKFLFLGDDRNIVHVYVDGRMVI